MNNWVEWNNQLFHIQHIENIVLISDYAKLIRIDIYWMSGRYISIQVADYDEQDVLDLYQQLKQKAFG